MRGAEANHVLVLIDGVEANGGVTQGSEFNLPSFYRSNRADRNHPWPSKRAVGQ